MKKPLDKEQEAVEYRQRLLVEYRHSLSEYREIFRRSAQIDTYTSTEIRAYAKATITACDEIEKDEGAVAADLLWENTLPGVPRVKSCSTCGCTCKVADIETHKVTFVEPIKEVRFREWCWRVRKIPNSGDYELVLLQHKKLIVALSYSCPCYGEWSWHIGRAGDEYGRTGLTYDDETVNKACRDEFTDFDTLPEAMHAVEDGLGLPDFHLLAAESFFDHCLELADVGRLDKSIF